jgi:hypothetical protein
MAGWPSSLRIRSESESASSNWINVEMLDLAGHLTLVFGLIECAAVPEIMLYTPRTRDKHPGLI